MKKAIVLTLVIIFFTTSCVVEKQFNTSVTLSNSTIHIDFKGEYIALEAFEHRNDTPEEERMKYVTELDKGIRAEIEQRGGTYTSTLHPDGIIVAEFSVSTPYPKGRRDDFGNVFKILNEGNGVYIFQHSKLKDKDITDMEKIGIAQSDLVGDICFKVEEGVDVLDENADSKPSLLSSCYKWKLEYGKKDDLMFKISIPSNKSVSNYDPKKCLDILTEEARERGINSAEDLNKKKYW